MMTHRNDPASTKGGRPAVCLTGLLVLLPGAAAAQSPLSIERLQAEDRAAGDLFGCALDLRAGDLRAVLLVGSLRDDDLGPNSGAAYVFELAAGDAGWVQTAKVLAPDGAAGDELGFSVALAPAGDAALLGAPLAGSGGAVYRAARGRSGGWAITERLAAAEPGASLGSSVAFAGALVAAGAPTATTGERRGAGAVFLFGGDGGAVRRLASDAPRTGDAFGWSLAFGGGTLAVGAPWADGRFTDTGAVHLFDLESGAPGERFLAPDARPFDAFGYSVALDGNLLAVSAPRADGGAGAVYLYRRGQDGFALEARLGGTVPGAQLGTSVALAGGVLAAGARGEGGSTGAVRLFRRLGGTWVETERFAAPLARSGDEVGIDVALSGDGLAAGAYKDDTGGTDAGSVHVRVPPPAEEPEEPEEPPAPVVADLSFAIAPGSEVAVPGEELSYALEICNLGPSAAPKRAFGSGALGPGFLDPTWTCSGSGGGACAPTAGTGPIAGTLRLPAGGCVTYDLTVRVDPCALDPLVLAGGVGTPAFDPDPANNADQAITPVAPNAELAVTIAPGPPDQAVYRAGDTVSLIVAVTNAGPSCAFGVPVAAPLPPSLVAIGWTCAPGPGATCAAGIGALADAADLPPGTSVVYTVAASVAPGFLGPQTASATVATPQGLDGDATNDRAETDLVLLPPPGVVAATKSVVGDLRVGGSARYEIVLANGGTSDLPDSPGFELIDPLPVQVEMLSAEASRGTIVPDQANVHVFWNGDLPAGEVVVISATVRILPSGQSSLVSNQAVFNFLEESDPDSLIEGKTAPPGAPEEGPTTFTVLSTVEIPTASAWGLAALAFLLAVAAAGLLRHGPGSLP